MAASGMTVLPSLRVGVTSTDSHLIGTFSLSVSLYRYRNMGAAYVGRRVDVLDRLRDFRSDTVTLDESHCEFALCWSPLSACSPMHMFPRVRRRIVIGPYIVALGALELGDLVFGGDGVSSRLGLYLRIMLAVVYLEMQLKLYRSGH